MNNKFYPMNSAEVLDQVLEVYKKSFFKQLAIAIIFNILFLIAVYIFLIIGVIAAAALFVGTAFQPGFGFGAIIMIAILILLVLLFFSAYTALTSTGNALITKQTFLGEYCDVGRVLKVSFKKIWVAASAALANLIVLIPAFIFTAIVVFFYIALIIGLADAGLMAITPILVLSFVLLLLIIAFFMLCATITMMSMSVAIFEGKWFFSAVKRSFMLVRPDFLKLMGLLAVWSVVTTVFSYSFEVFLGIGTSLGGYFLPQEYAAAFMIGTMGIRMLFSIVISTLLFPLSGIFSTMLYINQRIKHEGLDIELNLNMLRR